MAGLKAFQEAYLTAGTVDDLGNYSDFDARRIRYDIYWAWYENSVFRNVHKWASAYRTTFGLYRYIRNIYNPAYRLGEFWRGHLWGGQLDMQAGDGTVLPSALPIVTDNVNLRPAIAQVWKASNWQVKKDIVSLWGSVLGDVVIQVVDDTDRGKVYLKVTHPGTIKSIDLDDFGNVKGYVIERTRKDPRNKERSVTYKETAERDGDNVVYRTFLNDKPFAWDGEVFEWAVGYTFVPMVFFKHNDVGLDWGWSEFHAAQSKLREVDDLASKLSDQIRKLVNSPYLFSGVSKPDKKTEITAQKPTSDNPEPGREDVPALYGPVGSDAKALVSPIDIQATAEYINSILKVIEKDYPELSLDINNAKGDLSGRALRIHQQPASDKVLLRRATYDDALVRVQKMAVAIGGWRGYQGYEGFGLESYDAGALEHSIGDRPVFGKDPIDDIEMDMEFYKAANEAKKFGIPPLVYLKRQGWTDKDIAEIANSPEYQAHVATLNSIVDASNQLESGDNASSGNGFQRSSDNGGQSGNE